MYVFKFSYLSKLVVIFMMYILHKVKYNIHFHILFILYELFMFYIHRSCFKIT